MVAYWWSSTGPTRDHYFTCNGDRFNPATPPRYIGVDGIYSYGNTLVQVSGPDGLIGQVAVPAGATSALIDTVALAKWPVLQATQRLGPYGVTISVLVNGNPTSACAFNLDATAPPDPSAVGPDRGLPATPGVPPLDGGLVNAVLSILQGLPGATPGPITCNTQGVADSQLSAVLLRQPTNSPVSPAVTSKTLAGALDAGNVCFLRYDQAYAPRIQGGQGLRRFWLGLQYGVLPGAPCVTLGPYAFDGAGKATVPPINLSAYGAGAAAQPFILTIRTDYGSYWWGAFAAWPPGVPYPALLVDYCVV